MVRAGARARAPRGLRRPEAIGIHSLGVAQLDPRRPARAPTSSWPRASGASVRSRTPRTRSPRRSTSRRCRRVTRRDRIAVRHVFEDTLQPFVEVACGAAVGYVLANQAGIARVARRPEQGARAPRRERRALRGRRTTMRAAPRCSSGARTSPSQRASCPRPRAHLERALELRRELQRPPRRRSRALGPRARRDGGGELRRGRVASRRGARHLPACGRPLGAREHAVAHGRPRPRARPARRGGGRSARSPVGPRRKRSGSGGSRARSRASPRSRCCAAIPPAPPLCSRRRASSYAARDDEIGVAAVEERLQSLAIRVR